MFLTRERWCCARLSSHRLEMNICQTSIKADILFSVAVAHILGLSDRHKITTLVPSELT